MARYSLRSFVQKELAAALELVPYGGEGDHLPGGSPGLRHAEPVVSQVRQAGSGRILGGTPRAIECRPLPAGKGTSDVTSGFDHRKTRPVIVANADQLPPAFLQDRVGRPQAGLGA